MKLPMYIIPDEIIQRYNLNNIVEDNWVYIESLKDMYGLNQSGRIAHDKVVKHLLPYGYTPSKHTPDLWTHDTRPISSMLYVDDIGIKYIGEKIYNTSNKL